MSEKFPLLKYSCNVSDNPPPNNPFTKDDLTLPFLYRFAQHPHNRSAHAAKNTIQVIEIALFLHKLMRPAFRLIKRRPAASEITGVVNDLLSIGVTVASLLGIGDSLSSSQSDLFRAIDGAPLAFRLVLMVLLAAGFGWALASFSARLTRTNAEQRHYVAYGLAFVMAAVLVGTSEVLADTTGRAALPQVPLFTVFGATLTILLCRYLYRTRAIEGARTLHSRAICLAVFSISCVGLLILVGLD